MGEEFGHFNAAHNIGVDSVILVVVIGLMMFIRALYDGLRK
jgi:hypothetical protein